MPFTVNYNPVSVNARRHLESTEKVFAEATERLASGKRINKAMDDAAGLSISGSMEAKIRSIAQAKRNAQDAIGLVQVAEGGMTQVGNLLVRMRELAIQSANDSIGDNERQMLQGEVSQIKEEISRLAETTQYFGTSLLNGSGREFTFQVGPENTENDRITYSTKNLDLRLGTLGVDGVDLSTSEDSLDSLAALDEALTKITLPRAEVGAMQSRFNVVISNLMTYEENMMAAKSRILDADVAAETAKAIQGSILQKAGASVLMQANAQATQVLRLLE